MSSDLPNEIIDAVRQALFRGNKIEAIKLYREATGLGLTESKEFIDALEAELPRRSPVMPSSVLGEGCSSIFAVVAVAIPLAAWMTLSILR